jgi:hypothetical protein
MTVLRFWVEDAGQDIAEYAVMLAVILVLVVGTIWLECEQRLLQCGEFATVESP